MNLKLKRFAAICGLVVLLAAPGVTLAQRGVTQTVRIVDFAFEPPSLTYVLPGTEIHWSNESASNHWVTSRSTPFGSFNSGVIGPAGSFDVTLWEQGEYAYYCQLHPEMTGTIHVGIPAPELPW